MTSAGPTLDAIRSRVEPWLAPIAQSTPAGNDASLDPDFDAVTDEIAKLQSASAKQGVNWKRVVEIGTRLLTHQTKDLRLACYVAHGLCHTQGISGLAGGCLLVQGLVGQYYEQMQPPSSRQRARIGAIEWFVSRSAAWLEQASTAEGDATLVCACVDAFESLVTHLEARFGPGAIALGELRAVLRALAGRLTPAPTLEEVLEDAQELWAVGAEQRPGGPAGSPRALDHVGPFLVQCGAALCKVAARLFVQQPDGITSYRLNRLGAFLPLTDPEVVKNLENDATLSDEVLASIRAPLDGQDLSVLLAECERALARAPLALELHWTCARTLEALGRFDARHVVVSELRGLIYRHPELESRVSGSSDRVSPEASAWYLNEVLVQSSTSSSELGSELDQDMAAAQHADAGHESDEAQSPNSPTRKLKQIVERARELMLSDEPVAAIEFLQDEAADSSNGLDKLRVQLAQARLCQEGGMIQLANSLYGILFDVVMESHLGRWDPDLCSDCLAGYLSCLQQIMVSDDSAELQQRVKAVVTQLLKIDPVTAVKIALSTS